MKHILNNMAMRNNKKNQKKSLSTSVFTATYSHCGGIHRWTASNPFAGGTIFMFGLTDKDYWGLKKLGYKFENQYMLRGVGDMSMFASNNPDIENKFRALNGSEQLTILDSWGTFHSDLLNGGNKENMYNTANRLPSPIKDWCVAFLDCLIDAGNQVVANYCINI